MLLRRRILRKWLYLFSFLSCSTIHSQTINQLWTALDTTSADTSIAFLYADLSFKYARINTDTCKMYADSVRSYALKGNDQDLQQMWNYYQAVCEKNAGNYDQALQYLQPAIAYFGVHKDSARYASILYQEMICHYYKRDQLNFLKVANQCIDLYRAMGSPLKIAKITNSKASFYKNLKSYDKAKSLAEEALHIYEVENDSSGMATACNALGVINSILGNDEIALTYFQRQHAINTANNNTWGLGYSNENLGDMYLKVGDFEKAEAHFRKSMKIRKKINGKMELGGILMQMAELRLQQKRYSEALQFGEESYALCEQSKNRKQQKLVAELLSRIHEALGNYQVSLDYFKKYDAEKDTMLNETISQQIIEIETTFETKEKEKEIARLSHLAEIDQLKISQQRSMIFAFITVLAILTFLFYRIFRQKKQIEAQNEIISKALSEKDILLREIHHRVKNNLQLVSSLLGLQSSHIQDPNALQALNSGKSRVKSMALIHQNLYNKENLTGVSVREYIEKLSRELLDSFNINQEKIQLHIDIPEILIDVDTLVPMGLIINELLTNALKYAFPNQQGGNIHIAIVEQNEFLQLSFSDDGIGIDFDQKSADSFGYKLIDTLLEQLDGEMEINNKNGTQLDFKFNDYKIAA